MKFTTDGFFRAEFGIQFGHVILEPAYGSFKFSDRISFLLTFVQGFFKRNLRRSIYKLFCGRKDDVCFGGKAKFEK